MTRHRTVEEGKRWQFLLLLFEPCRHRVVWKRKVAALHAYWHCDGNDGDNDDDDDVDDPVSLAVYSLQPEFRSKCLFLVAMLSSVDNTSTVIDGNNKLCVRRHESDAVQWMLFAHWAFHLFCKLSPMKSLSCSDLICPWVSEDGLARMNLF